MEEKSTHIFHGGAQFEQLPLRRGRGKQREQSCKRTVITILFVIIISLFVLNMLVYVIFISGDNAYVQKTIRHLFISY